MSYSLLILIVLAIPAAAIVSLVLSLRTHTRLRLIEQRLDALQKWLAAQAGLEPSPESPPAAVPAVPRIEIEDRPESDEPLSRAAEAVPEPPAPPLPPVKAKATLEERFGAQWAVWIGGIALALGGFFLVRYSIEQGWFGPAQRVLLGALVALASIAAGEWTRRHEIKSGMFGLPTAHIPSVLTAAGTAIAYADAYAAYALYGFIGPAVAFVLLGIVALLTLAAALLHGPALAGLGLIGAFITPLIVSTETPNYWALYLYLAIVTGAGFALARAKMWRWLAIAAIAASVAWSIVGLGDLAALTPQVFYLAACYTLAALLIVSGLLFGPDAVAGEIDFVSSAALAAYLVASTLLVLATGQDSLALALFVILVASTVAIAWRSEAAVAAVPAAAILVALIFWHWSIDFDVAVLGLPNGPVPDSLWKPDHYLFGTPLMLGAGFALLFGAAGYLAQSRASRPLAAILWSAAAVFAPLAILIALHWRIADFDRSIPFAAAAVLLAGAFAFATETLSGKSLRTIGEAPVAIFATGTIASLALALSLALEKGWLTIALALMVPGIAWIAEKRPWPALRWLAAAVTVAVLGRIIWDPRIVGDAIGTEPVFNWLLYGYGVPALSFFLAGYMMRREADDVPVRLVDAASILFTVLLIVLEVRHALSGDPFEAGSALAETALDVSLLLAVVIGLERLRVRSGSVVHDFGALILGGIVLVMIARRLAIDANPFFTGEPVGGPFINLVLLGYGIPALLAGVLAFVTYGVRPYRYSIAAGAAALALALGYLSLEICRLYHGPVLTAGPVSDAEQYTYSAVWLLFGVALLCAGLWLRSRPLRIASAAVLVLTVLKVFLVDMSNLTGIYRALSFLGLGVVLIGIGWLYQRLLFPPAPVADQPSAAD
jgi:uncharacterized membrane protein